MKVLDDRDRLQAEADIGDVGRQGFDVALVGAIPYGRSSRQVCHVTEPLDDNLFKKL